MASAKAPKDKAAAKGKQTVEKKAVKLERLKVEYVGVGDIKPNAYNPNRQSEHDFELLKRSMEEDGFTQPVIVMRDTMTIVDGEHRWRAWQALGHTELPIVKVDMTPEQMRIATLRHNRARGSEDVELTAQVLRDLRELGALDWAQDSLMMDDTELQKLIDDVSAPDALAGKEFSEGWKPGEVAQDATYADPNARVNLSGMTKEAADAVREQEKKVAEAKTQEEREAAKRDMAVYRVSVVFTADQANIVKSVLGDRPAEKIMELCKAAYDAAQAVPTA